MPKVFQLFLAALLLVGYVFPSNGQDLFEESDSLYNKGVYDESYNLLIKLSSRFEENGDSANLLKARLKIADINRAASNFQYALKYLKETEEIFKNSSFSLNELYEKRSAVYYEINDKDSSKKYIEKAFKRKKQLYHQSQQKDNFLLYGAIYRFFDLDTALKYLHISESHFNENNDKLNLALCLYNLGLCARNNDENDLAEQYFLREEHLADSMKVPVYQIQAYSNLMTLNYEKKDYKKVYEYYRKLNQLEQRLPEKNNLNKLISAVNSVEEIKITAESELQNTKLEFQKKLNGRRNTILIGVMLILILLSFILFLKYQQHAKTKEILKKQQDLNTEINRQKNALKKALFLKNKLISIIGHDLIGPLKSLKSVLDLSALGELNAEERKLIDNQLSGKLSGSLEILGNLVAYAKSIDVEGVTKETLDEIKLTIADTIANVEELAAEKSIKIESDILQDKFRAPKFFVEVALRNLLTNAIKYSPEKATINVNTKEDSNAYEIIVTDEGVGMSDEVLEKLNSGASFSSSKEGTGKEKGNGLGMRLVQEIAKNLGFKILYNQGKSKGTVAKIIIPK